MRSVCLLRTGSRHFCSGDIRSDNGGSIRVGCCNTAHPSQTPPTDALPCVIREIATISRRDHAHQGRCRFICIGAIAMMRVRF
jgi:hypothetical protein